MRLVALKLSGKDRTFGHYSESTLSTYEQFRRVKASRGLARSSSRLDDFS